MHRLARVLFLILTLVLTPHTIRAQSSTPASDDLLDRLLQRGVDAGLTGVTLWIEQENGVIYDRAFGLARSETKTPLLVGDRFRIYSITKVFTAVLILQLVDAGVLSLDDTVTRWLDEPVVQHIPDIERITLRQLLGHTSGVADCFDPESVFWQDAYLNPDANWTRVWTSDELLAYVDGARRDPVFPPGAGVQYSNTGYLLLGKILEAATGRSYADLFQTRILDPLDLSDTAYAASEPGPAAAVDGYHLFGGDLVNVSATHLSAQGAAGGMVSTTRDLTTFVRALFGGELLSPAVMSELTRFTPSERPGIDWGLGVARLQTPDGVFTGMGGSGPGFTARMFMQLDTGLTVGLLTNTNRDDETVDLLFNEIVHVVEIQGP